MGRPWQQQQQRQQRQRPLQPSTEVTYEPSTAAAYAYYDDQSANVDESSSSSDQSLQEHPELDYGDSERQYVEPERVYAEPEQNYEVDEAVSVLSNGRVHGVQQQQVPTTTVRPRNGFTTTSSVDSPTSFRATATETRKSGYVVDEKHYRKYRVEEETPDGFIVGEYGVVSHHDGTTRGVRYTADSSINPRVIYEALAKFLALRRRR